MRFKLDENMPDALGTYLANIGHNVETAAGEKLGGVPDPILFGAAVQERRTLMTFDTDFADIRRYPPKSHCGIVVFRLDDQRWSSIKYPVEQLLSSLERQACEGVLVIVEQDRIRRRRAGPT